MVRRVAVTVVDSVGIERKTFRDYV